MPRVNLPISAQPSQQPCNNLGQPWQTWGDTAFLCANTPGCEDSWIGAQFGRDDLAARWPYHAGMLNEAQGQTQTWFDAVEALKIGRYVHWSEGAHDLGRYGQCFSANKADPVMGCRWYDSGWEPFYQGPSQLRLDRSFPAFTAFSLDGDYGGRDDCISCQGSPEVPGDTGYVKGDRVGSINRYLRWNTATIVDLPTRWVVSISMVDDPVAQGIPGAGCSGGTVAGFTYPPCFDENLSAVATVDVTPRRLQAFDPEPGELVAWATSTGQQGLVAAGAGGVVTVPGVLVRTTPTRLALRVRP